MPGVIDSTTNYVEHPELVCQRLVRYAHRVGRERVGTKVTGGLLGFSSRERVVESMRVPCPAQATKALPLSMLGISGCVQSQRDALVRGTALRRVTSRVNA